jgi:ribonuclease inhibitor
MKEITIDCTTIASMAEIHDILARELNFPAWYGRNLDALHDCLTDLKDVELVLIGWPDEGYLSRVRRVIVAAAWENDHLSVRAID